ncbi:MAG TPA: hypothetical protein VMB25_00305 [Bryobacteraceae bacterium]|nr:hypothetical protein [Bryobacteraceae bacterium]
MDDPARAVPDLVRFAAEDRADDLVDLEPQLIDLFRHLRTPESLPFLIKVVRGDPSDVPDEVLESLVELSGAAVDPLLALLAAFPADNPGDVPFLLAALHVQDPRIFEALQRHAAADPDDAAMCLEVYNDPGVKEPSEPFNIWELYSEEDSPDWTALSDEERLAILGSGSAQLRLEVAESYCGSELAEAVRVMLLDMAGNDPEPSVRGACWEALEDLVEEPDVRRAMLAVLKNASASWEEKAGAGIALAQQTDNPEVPAAIEALYGDPRSRSKALKAMARSFNPRFGDYPPRHLEDPDPETRRQAIWGVGYLNLSSQAPRLEAFFNDEEFRTDAMFAYALSVPGETSPGRARVLLKKVATAAGGFREDEEELVQVAIDQRLMLHGKKAVFFPDDEEEP